MNNADFIIVGAGLTGATIARILHDSNREVVVLERSPFVGGLCSDTTHYSGIRYNLFGPHYFRTRSSYTWEYARRFAEFIPFEAVVKSWVSGEIYDWPVTEDYITRTSGKDYHKDRYAGTPNFEGRCLERMPRDVYELFVRGYTEKMWGRSARDMDESLATRIDIRSGSDRRLSTKPYQGIPEDGYTSWIENMFDGIPVITGVDYLESKFEYTARKLLIFTGKIDALFSYDLGKLEHRSQMREHTYTENCELKLPTCQMNYPSLDTEIIREIEWKHIWPSMSSGTLITSEIPSSGGDEYPVPDARNTSLARRYKNRVESTDGIVVCGRLGENEYMDMDSAIDKAMIIAQRIIGGKYN